MQEKQRPQIGLPLPKWCFVLLGITTFCLPLALLGWAVCTLAGGTAGEPDWILATILALWLVYVAWIGFSKRLTWREKALWFFVVIWGSVIGMPVFHVFMVRRYLGLEGRTNKRDRAALDRFLTRHGIDHDRLSTDQSAVLLSHCRRNRLAKWALVPMAALAALLLYMATVYFPQQLTRICTSFVPTHLVIIDSATDTKKEFAPEPEHVETYVKMVMTFGGMAGMQGAMGLIMLSQALVFSWRGSGHRKALIEFLKVTTCPFRPPDNTPDRKGIPQ